MEILLQKANINFSKIRSFLTKTTGNELMKLSEICYYPSHQKFYFQLLDYCSLTDKDIKEYVKRFWKGRPEATRLISKDPVRMFYVFLLYLMLNDKTKIGAYPTTMLLIGIREYSNLMYKHIQYCNEDYFRYALEHLAKTHLFVREKTIGNGIYFLSKQMINRYTREIKKGDKDKISKFIQEYRNRISQSIKSFANGYYKAHSAGASIKVDHETDEENHFQKQSQDKKSRLVDEIVKKITVYKTFDKQAMLESKQLTKIGTPLATLISNQLCDMKYSDHIRSCLLLFLKDVKDVGMICGTSYFSYIRKLMGIKRTKEIIYFKKQNNELLNVVIKDLKFDKKYDSFTNQTKFSINLYLAYYVTMFLRKSIC